MHRGLTTSSRQPAWSSISTTVGVASATRPATLTHLLHAGLLLGDVLVVDRRLLGGENGADLRGHLLAERLHLREGLGAIATALHRLADRLHLRLILRVDLGDRRPGRRGHPAVQELASLPGRRRPRCFRRGERRRAPRCGLPSCTDTSCGGWT